MKKRKETTGKRYEENVQYYKEQIGERINERKKE